MSLKLGLLPAGMGRKEGSGAGPGAEGKVEPSVAIVPNSNMLNNIALKFGANKVII